VKITPPIVSGAKKESKSKVFSNHECMCVENAVVLVLCNYAIFFRKREGEWPK
jgi:hypothetical protein